MAGEETGGRRQRALIGGLWFAASQFVPFFGTAVLSVVAGRMLGSERLGFQSLVAFTEAAAFAILVQSATTSCTRTLSNLMGRGATDSQEEMAWWTIRFHLVVGLVGALIISAYALTRHDGEPSWALASISNVANAAGWGWGSIVIATRGWSEVGQRRLVSQLGAAVISILAILLGGGIEWIFIANIAGSVWVAFELRKRAHGIPRRRSVHPAAAFWSFYGLAALSQLIGQVAVQRSEFFILDRDSTDSQVAMYSIAFMLVMVAVSIPAALTSAMMPEIARATGEGRSSDLQDHLAKAIRVIWIASVLMSMLVAMLGPSTVMLVYGHQYTQAGNLTALAALGLLVLPVWQLCSDFWTGHGRLGPVLVAGAISGVVDVIIALIVIRSHGAAGAVAAKLSSQYLMAVLLVGFTWVAHGRRRLITWGWLRLVAVCFAAVLTQRWLSTGHGPVFGFLSAAALALATIAVGMFLMRPLVRGDADWLARVLPAMAGPWLMRASHGRSPAQMPRRAHVE